MLAGAYWLYWWAVRYRRARRAFIVVPLRRAAPIVVVCRIVLLILDITVVWAGGANGHHTSYCR